MQGSAPFLLSGKAVGKPAREVDRGDSVAGRKPRRKQPRDASEGSARPQREQSDTREQAIETGMDRFRIEVGHQHKVKPGNIVGAIANEADIDSKYIGRINIFDDYSLVDLPENMPKELLRELKSVRIAGQRLNITLLKGRKRNDGPRPTAEQPQRGKPKTRHRDKKNKGKPKRARQR